LGETLAKFKVFGARGSVEIEALVDTGATFTKISRSHAEKVGIEPKYETEVELADGGLVSRKLGLSDIQIADVRRPVLVAVGSDGEKPVLGYATLENLGFKVNPITRQLERARPIEF
jgi:clan AA aspartic protease